MFDGAVRTLTHQVQPQGAFTVANCIAACQAANYVIAGMEYAATPVPTPTPTPTPTAPIVAYPAISGWTAKGCYADLGRTLQYGVAVTGGMTIEKCLAACLAAKYTIAGVEYAGECWCDTQYRLGGGPAPDGDAQCNMKCSGNQAQLCGGPNRLAVWEAASATISTTTPVAPPVTTSATVSATTPAPSTASQWEYLGCYVDNVNTRTLRYALDVGGKNSHENCQAVCLKAGYAYSGTEYTAECFCDSTISNGGAKAADGEAGCNMPCQAGLATDKCGGGGRLTLYHYTGTITAPVTPVNPPAGGGGGGTNVAPVTTGLPSTWAYRGCYIDNANGRILANQRPDSTTLTVESCINACTTLGFSVAGMEYSTQCFCGNTIINGGVVASLDSQCNMPCGGKAAEACGAGNRMSIYSTSANLTTLGVPTAQKTGLPAGWTYSGCVTDSNQQRALPIEIDMAGTLTPEKCISQCAAFGYTAAGLEYGSQCYCGDPSDLVKNGAKNATEAQCSFACDGLATSLCGAGLLLTMYTTTPATWNTPANAGRYEFLIGGLVVPLITTLGINNKVTFVEKFGTGAPNTTGAYELDYSRTNDMNAAWRTMHMQANGLSDVFCAVGITLPDKSGRVVTIGGWSFDSTYGVRFYTPDGSPGVPGKNDWQENNKELALQDGRWYPGAMIMANGSILVVGGERGSNDIAVPTLEVLPKPAGGRTALYMDWLARTDPNNLYPYLYVLPGGGIFVQYYNEARILDENSFNTIKTLPNVPGSVRNPAAGRTYPLQGAAAIFPQYAPYSDPITFIVCGGSEGIGQNAGNGLDNCASIQPEGQNPNWVIERMPSRRVMGNMVSLPDGTFLILNGGQTGVAGFGLGKNPNLQALLYDPSKPLGSRMSILGSTIVARMYHSEAILLHDGRVLVTGSDPQDPEFPEEFRVEVYVPPYLTDGRTQPQFTIAAGQTDWAYGSSHSITVTRNTGAVGSMRVSLVAPISSTHGNSVNQRILFPQVNCGGNQCTIVAPPNAHVCPPGWYQLFLLDGPTPSYSQWVHIGGDPASLGNWPNFPDFTKPGV
ncbi:hypothetical protein QFC22_004737 [Naganishia vaughanmartiniae]|uniref:Uncharacterized protein n=1 Tax=Naganishia vaughanmartiniae TaxID=1424756 RepID=A0ACC2X0L0_9TREE|nr:hypothetical protein QFC22_004737 [Naganishia vaughanmartiniae]